MSNPETPLKGTQGEFIQNKILDLSSRIRIIINHLPKLDRWSLGANLRQYMWNSLELCERTRLTTDIKQKQKFLLEIKLNLSLLKFMIRSGALDKIISSKNYTHSIEAIDPIVKIIDSWYNKISNKPSKG